MATVHTWPVCFGTSQTACEIVSIDVADVDVGENIGARLQADPANADSAAASELTHVPLFIKAPGQSARTDVIETFGLLDIGDLVFEHLLNERREDVEDYVKAVAGP